MIDVLSNDSDPDGDLQTGTLEVTAIPRIGSAVVTGGLIAYTPQKDAFGTDRFSYRVCDSQARCSGAAVEVVVESVNDPPTAEPISASTPQGEVLGLSLGFSDPEGDPISCRLSKPPFTGAATVPADCSRLTYSPPPTFSGVASFEIEVSDGVDVTVVPVTVAVGSATTTTTTAATTTTTTVPATTTTTVPATTTTTIPPPPGFNPTDDVVEALSGKNTVFDPTVNDSAGDKKTVTIVSGPANGTASVIASGNLRYTSNAGFTGTDTLVYQVCAPGGFCGTATVTINVR